MDRDWVRNVVVIWNTTLLFVLLLVKSEAGAEQAGFAVAHQGADAAHVGGHHGQAHHLGLAHAVGAVVDVGRVQQAEAAPAPRHQLRGRGQRMRWRSR